MVVGTTPTELAITRRLVAARDLLTKSELGISRVAYASGFQSLRRFNATFQERWGTTPRRVRSIGAAIAGRVPPLVLRLSYRGALAWDGLRRRLLSGAMPGTACMSGERYAATVRLEGCAGHVVAGHDARQERIDVRVSADLVHAVVPLVRRLRRLFDLDADVSSIDRDLTLGGLGAFVPLEPGVRLAGTLDPFGAALTCLVTRNSRAGSSGRATLLSLTHAFGESLETDIPGLDCLPLAPERIAEAGVGGLERLGMPASTASAVHRVALLFAESLAPVTVGGDPEGAVRFLSTIIPDPRVALELMTRVMGWPDAFDSSDEVLQARTGLSRLDWAAETWRPWRAYAAERLRLAPADAVPVVGDNRRGRGRRMDARQASNQMSLKAEAAV
jgi:AraC family transcriptional regulator of adaptative response / DNA-3-methyladenine glycosylase II